MPALGEEFRSAREARGLTLSDVAEQIHIRSVYLHAIENEEWTSIGAPVYVRGFIRTYARFLGLEAESAVERFNQSAPAARPVSHSVSAVASERDRPGPSVWAIVATAAAVLLVAFVGYEWWSYSQAASGGRTAATVAPRSDGAQPAPVAAGSEKSAIANASAVPSAGPSGPPAAILHHQLALRLTQRSWIRVTVDGSTKVEGIFPAGTTRTFSGNVADVRAGNAAGVTISVNGAAAASMGKEGDVVEQRYTL